MRNDIDDDALRALKAAGIVGVAFNATFHGVDYYRDAASLLDRLAALDLCVSFAVQHGNLRTRADVRALRVRVFIDHCGCPTPSAGPDQPGFRRLPPRGNGSCS